MKKFLGIVFAACALTLSAAPFKLTENGGAKVYIVIGDNPSPVTVQAARELQKMVQMITGARLNILASRITWAESYIYMGTDKDPHTASVARKYSKQLRGNDGYAVTCKSPKAMYIVAFEPKGLLNAVQRLIYKNTDFIWVRPFKEAAVYTRTPTLELKHVNYVDVPKFVSRGWAANRKMALFSEEFELYASRMCMNLTFIVSDAALDRRERLGLSLEYGGGHNLAHIWLPLKKYGKTNPEFYMEVGGKRIVEGRTHMCFSNPEMKKEFIANALRVIRQVPEHFKCVNMMIEDTPLFCQCKNCSKPIRLPGGKVLKKTDPAYKSTLFFMFLNDVVEAVQKERPGLLVKSFAYFFSAVPPAVKVHPMICVSFCPYVRNDKQTLHGETNGKWLERTKKWAKMSSNVIWREYYYSGAGYPRAQANIIAQDLSFINKLGIKRIYSELSWTDAIIARKKGPSEQEFFAITGPEFWVINQLFWDPTQNPDELRNEYIRRTYREAAPAVSKFYKIIRDSWLNDPSAAAFNDDYRNNMGRQIVDKNLTGDCRQALAEAAKLVKDPRSKEHLKNLTDTFEAWLKIAISGSANEQRVPRVEVKGEPGFDFNSGVWAKAASLPKLKRMGTSEDAAEPTDIKVMHDGVNFYVAMRCPYPGELTCTPGRPRDQWPRGDHAEIFLTYPGSYLHLVFDAYGNRYDALGTDNSWNGDWTLKVENKPGEWRAVMIVPFTTFKARIEQNNKIPALFYRVRGQRPGTKSLQSTWGGGKVHSADTFGNLIFDLE